MSNICRTPIECPICDTNTTHYLICCNEQHRTCLSCVQKLLHDCDCGSPSCIGIGWKCPICRSHLSLNKYQLLCVGFGSHKILAKIN